MAHAGATKTSPGTSQYTVSFPVKNTAKEAWAHTRVLLRTDPTPGHGCTGVRARARASVGWLPSFSVAFFFGCACLVLPAAQHQAATQVRGAAPGRGRHRPAMPKVRRGAGPRAQDFAVSPWQRKASSRAPPAPPAPGADALPRATEPGDSLGRSACDARGHFCGYSGLLKPER